MDGLILLDKPAGVTSFQAVAMMRRATGEKRCGHTGTLDPMATGLLPVLVGRATKLSDYLLAGDKAYRAELQFGVSTDSYDLTGRVTGVGGRIPDFSEIEKILPDFLGEQLQTPPMFSAIKRDGVKLYKLARAGIQRDIPPREITIYDLKPLDYKEGRLLFDVSCSKGTYIRSLCVDIAARLGTIGCMSALRRTRTLGFSVESAVAPDEAAARLAAGDRSFVLSPREALPLDTYRPPAFFARLLANGLAVDRRKLPDCPKGPVWVAGEETLFGIGKLRTDGAFQIVTHL